MGLLMPSLNGAGKDPMAGDAARLPYLATFCVVYHSDVSDNAVPVSSFADSNHFSNSSMVATSGTLTKLPTTRVSNFSKSKLTVIVYYGGIYSLA